MIVRFSLAGRASEGDGGPGWGLTGSHAGRLSGPSAAMADGDTSGVGDRDAYLAVRAGHGEPGEVAAQVWVEDAESVRFARPVREAEQRGQRDHQVSQDRASRGLSAWTAAWHAIAWPAAARAAVAWTAVVWLVPARRLVAAGFRLTW